MLIHLLGTGSADGWPNAFCTCASCAAQRDAGQSRAPASALVDGRVLIDPGPTSAHTANRLGIRLRDVEHVLVTHGHPDHLDPAFLLARQWAHPERVLHVWGPPRAVDLCRDWLGPDAAVELHVVAAGDVSSLDTLTGTYVVRAVAAAHAHGDGDELALEALLYDVTGPDGQRLLYATDTGPLPPDALVGTAPVDAILVDATFGDHVTHGTGHLDLTTLPGMLASLGEGGILTPTTRVVATHLSHHNPPEPALSDRLAAMGVELPRDGDVVDTTRPSPLHADRRGPRRHLVIGGARSGKSRHAEELAAESGLPVVYVATGGTRAQDPEWSARVAAHRARRPAEWSTVETTDLDQVLGDATSDTLLLVDCLTLWLTAVLDDLRAWERCDAGDLTGVQLDAEAVIDDLVRSLAACPAAVIVVTNEVGWGLVPTTASVRLFRDLLGRTNIAVASACHDTTLVVAGRPLRLLASA